MRAFRKIAEETKNHDLERDLYILDREAVRGVYWRQWWEALKNEGWKGWPRNARRLGAHCLWIIIMGLYWAFADYGRSIFRPFVTWAVLTFIVFPSLYGLVLRPPSALGQSDAKRYEQAVETIANANSLPFVGPLTIDPEIKKAFGECLPIPPKSFQWLVVIQKVVSIILVFFIGLALRNYFKIM